VVLSNGACFAEIGNSVICVNKDAAKFESLDQGRGSCASSVEIPSMQMICS